MPEPGMGANNDHPTSSPSGGNSFGGGADERNQIDRSSQSTEQNIVQTQTTTENLVATPTDIERITAQPTTAENLSGFDPNDATSDGPGGGDPVQFNDMIENQQQSFPETHWDSDNDRFYNLPDSSPSPPPSASPIVVDPSVRNQNTADGPGGGDPIAFNNLMNLNIDRGDNVRDAVQAAASPAVPAQVLIPAIPVEPPPRSANSSNLRGFLSFIGRLNPITLL